MEMACRLAMGRDRDIVDGDMATRLYFAGTTQKMIAQKMLRQKSYFLYNAHLVRGLIFRCLIFRKRFGVATYTCSNFSLSNFKHSKQNFVSTKRLDDNCGDGNYLIHVVSRSDRQNIVSKLFRTFKYDNV